MSFSQIGPSMSAPTATQARDGRLFFLLDHAWHMRVIEFIVGLLMIAIYIWMLAGFVDLVPSKNSSALIILNFLIISG